MRNHERKIIRVVGKREENGVKMVVFQPVKKVKEDGKVALFTGRGEGYTPLHDHLGPWTFITPYFKGNWTPHISTPKTLRIAVQCPISGGR